MFSIAPVSKSHQQSFQSQEFLSSAERSKAVQRLPLNTLYLEPKDTFHKSCASALKFTGTGISKFLLDEDTPENSVAQEIFTAVKSKRNFPQDFPVLGSGRTSTVYGISDKYAFRLPLKHKGMNINLVEKSHIKVLPDPYPDSYLSQPLAKITVNKEPFFFLKRVPGKPGSMDYTQLRYGEGLSKEDYPNCRDVYIQYIKDVSDMPYSAFERLIRDIKQLDLDGKCIDPNPNNLMVDTVSSRLSLVDIGDKISEAKDRRYPPGKENNLAYILSMLVDMNFLELEYPVANYYFDLAKSGRHHHRQPRRRRRIMKNALQAACYEGFVKLPTREDYDYRPKCPLFNLRNILKTGNLNNEHCDFIEAQLEKVVNNPSLAVRRVAAQNIGEIFDNFSDTVPNSNSSQYSSYY